jgi:hypothetical protein
MGRLSFPHFLISGATMIRPDPAWLDRMYNNRALVPEHAAHFSRWAATSAQARASQPCTLDIAYRPNAGEKLDVFPAAEKPQGNGAPVLLFNHASQPVTILVAVPLAVTGAVVALLVTGTDISLPVLIGLIMLIGIAVKNSILLVDYAVIAQETLGMGRHEALLDACHKRARPVLMTTLAMGAGMLPIALGFAADSSFRAPMAIAVIGGLISSTVLSLVVMPAAFTWIDDVEDRLMRRFRRRTA